MQTNDDLLDIEIQTDEIETTTKWTQYPAEDNKGWGVENQKYNMENDTDDILKKYRTEINFNELQIFLNKSSKVFQFRVFNIQKSSLHFSNFLDKFYRSSKNYLKKYQ